MIIKTMMNKENNIKKFIYFNPYKKRIKLKTDNGGWWNDISWEIRDEHDNIIVRAPSLYIENVTSYNGELSKDYFIDGRTYKIILKTIDEYDEIEFELKLID